MKKIILIVLGVLLVLGGGIWGISKTGIFPNKVSYINNSQVQRVRDNGILRVGLDATYNPMEFIDENGNIVGFDADIVAQVAKEFGVPLELKNVTWDKLFNELTEGKIDLVISSITITSERSKFLSFSKPYFNAGQVIVALAKNDLITSQLSLKGKKIGVIPETTSEIEAKQLTDETMVVGYPDINLAINALLNGEVEAVIMDYPVAVNKKKNNSDLKLVGGPLTQEFYGVVAAKGKEGLLQPVNVVIESLLKSGEIKKIENKWLK